MAYCCKLSGIFVEKSILSEHDHSVLQAVRWLSSKALLLGIFSNEFV